MRKGVRVRVKGCMSKVCMGMIVKLIEQDVRIWQAL